MTMTINGPAFYWELPAEIWDGFDTFMSPMEIVGDGDQPCVCGRIHYTDETACLRLTRRKVRIGQGCTTAVTVSAGGIVSLATGAARMRLCCTARSCPAAQRSLIPQSRTATALTA